MVIVTGASAAKPRAAEKATGAIIVGSRNGRQR
jgi:hypothetical protein